jgi:hypothetical protein
MAPFSKVADWNSGEKGLSRPSLERGMVSYASAPAATSCSAVCMALLAALVFHIHQLAVPRHAVGDPGVIEGLRADFRSPPLMGNGVGQQSYAALVAHARAENGGQIRRPYGRQRIVRQLDHIERLDSGNPKFSVKKSYSLAAVCASWLPLAWWATVK